jgi:hypothetical protein
MMRGQRRPWAGLRCSRPATAASRIWPSTWAALRMRLGLSRRPPTGPATPEPQAGRSMPRGTPPKWGRIWLSSSTGMIGGGPWRLSLPLVRPPPAPTAAGAPRCWEVQPRLLLPGFRHTRPPSSATAGRQAPPPRDLPARAQRGRRAGAPRPPRAAGIAGTARFAKDPRGKAFGTCC